jgi:hypothetical protein
LKNTGVTTFARRRALAKEKSRVGALRFRLYKHCYQRVDQALDAGYHLEAIALLESMISDRLESRLAFLAQTDFSFKTLGALINKARAAECDPELRVLVIEKLPVWSKNRNEAIHEMAKLADGDTDGWEARQLKNSQFARDGLALLRKLDSRVKRLRKPITQSTRSGL